MTLAAKAPPGPRDWTFGLSQIREMKRDILGYYNELHRRYGDVVRLRFGPYLSYTFFHPDAVREVLVTKAKQFRRFPRPMDVLAQWNGRSVLITEGDEWVRQRRMVQPAFHPGRFERYAACMVERTRRRLERWLERIDASGGVETEIGKEMTGLTLEIIGKTMFGAEISAETSEIGRAVAILSEVAIHEMQSPWTSPDWLPFPAKRRKRWAMRVLDETVRGFIRERRASGRDEGDLLSMLLLAVDSEGDGGRFTDEQVRDQCMTLLIAGHDTTRGDPLTNGSPRGPRARAQKTASNRARFAGALSTAERSRSRRSSDRVAPAPPRRASMRAAPVSWARVAAAGSTAATIAFVEESVRRPSATLS